MAEAEDKVKTCEMKYTASPSEDTSAELERSKQDMSLSMTILFKVKSFDLKQPGMRKVKKF